MTDTAFEIAVAQHRGELRRHCARMVGASEAEDAVQETFLRAWRARHGHRRSLRPWLYRIATNVCCDQLAKRRPTVALEGEAVAPHEQRPDELVVAQEALELALTAIRRLPARQRASLVMRDVLRCSAAETATATSSSVAAVESALQRGRAALRAQLSADGPAGARTRRPPAPSCR